MNEAPDCLCYNDDDGQVSIIHSNMLQLQSAIEESRESSHGEVSTLENKVQELERRSVATQVIGTDVYSLSLVTDL